MPDISMCKNESCESKLDCYRFMAMPNDRQLYADFASGAITKECESFVPLYEYQKHIIKMVEKYGK